MEGLVLAEQCPPGPCCLVTRTYFAETEQYAEYDQTLDHCSCNDRTPEQCQADVNQWVAEGDVVWIVAGCPPE